MKLRFKKSQPPEEHDVQEDALVGYSVRDGEQSPLRISLEQLGGHTAIFGRARTGKTTLMSHLVHAVMNSRTALVVIDMDGDLVPTLASQIPAERAEDVCWINLNDKDWVPGFNPLDMSHGEDSEFILANLVHAAPALWGPYWKSDVEDALRASVRTLLAANRVLVEQNEHQFSLLDVPPLFRRTDFCRRLLRSFVTEPDVVEWWKAYLGRPSWLNEYDFAALLTPLHRLQLDRHASNILGQSASTFDLCEFMAPGRITLLDMHSAVLAADICHWIATLIADRINLTALRRECVPSEVNRPDVVIAVNGALSIPGLSDPDLLTNLRKRGISYILTNWSARNSEASDPGLQHAILANAANLFVFRTGRRDAEILSRELSSSTDLDAKEPRLASDRSDLKGILNRIRLPIRLVSDLKSHRKGIVERWGGSVIVRLRRLANLLRMRRREL